MALKHSTLVTILGILFCLNANAGDQPFDGPWYTGSNNGTPGLSSTTSNNFTWGGTSTSTAQSGILWSYFPTVSFSNDGDFVTVSFDVKWNDAAVASASGYRFGLYNNNGSTLTSNLNGINTDSAFNASRGYYAFWNLDNGGSSSSLYARNVGNNSPLSNSDLTQFANGPGANATSTTPTYSISFTITRNSSTSYNVSSTFNGNTVASNTTVITASDFNTLYLLNTPGMQIDSMTFSNFTVSSNLIPEPSTYALTLGGGLLLLGLFRNLKKRQAA